MIQHPPDHRKYGKLYVTNFGQDSSKTFGLSNKSGSCVLRIRLFNSYRGIRYKAERLLLLPVLVLDFLRFTRRFLLTTTTTSVASAARVENTR